MIIGNIWSCRVEKYRDWIRVTSFETFHILIDCMFFMRLWRRDGEMWNSNMLNFFEDRRLRKFLLVCLIVYFILYPNLSQAFGKFSTRMDKIFLSDTRSLRLIGYLLLHLSCFLLAEHTFTWVWTEFQISIVSYNILYYAWRFCVHCIVYWIILCASV